MKGIFISVLLIWSIMAVQPTLAQSGLAQSTGVRKPPTDIKIDQKLNSSIPLDLIFKDETGQPKRLGDFLGKKPIVLAPVYYNCPMLCTLILNGVVQSLNAVPFEAGKEFDVIAFSIDPKETPELAAEKKKSYLEHYKFKENSSAGWHFLTGDEDSIKKLTDAIGFRYKYDETTGQFAHASGIMILTPEGKLARYFYGIEYSPRDVKFGIMEASANRIGSPVDQILLLCYHYDPSTGKYGSMAMMMVRIGGILTVLCIGAFMITMWRIERRKTAA